MSATLVGTVRGYWAIGNVVSTTPPTLNSERGFASVARTGAGDFTLTMQDGLTLNADGGGVCLVTAYGAVPMCVSVEQPTPTTLRVRTLTNGGVATDADFGIAIQDVGPS